jgi:hypothetical protein
MVGTTVWAVKTNGAMTTRNRAELIAQALVARAAALPRRLSARLGHGQSAPVRIDVSAIRVPDSAAACRANALMMSLSAPWLANHCQRTYIWSAMLAQRDRIRVDEEILFVASVLHDLGLIDAHNGKQPGCECFAVEGARAAMRFAAEIGWDDERRDRLAEAISLHLNVRVGLRHGPEAHLLHEGAAFDVIGARLGQLHRETVMSVLLRHPRLGFKDEMGAAMRQQTRMRPQSRAAFLVRLGFIGMMRSAPLDDNGPSPRLSL